MVSAYFLNKLENFALWILYKSPRIGFICVKQLNTDISWYCKDPMDWTMTEDPFEPPAHYFERLYHQPSYGEDE